MSSHNNANDKKTKLATNQAEKQMSQTSCDNKKSKSNIEKKEMNAVKEESCEVIKKDQAAKSEPEYKEMIEIREKRLGFVIKILYVFGVMFITFGKDYFERDILKEKMDVLLSAACVTISLIMVIAIVVYIFYEMKCFRINYKGSFLLDIKIIQDAENNYVYLFPNFICSGSSSVLTLLFFSIDDIDIKERSIAICASVMVILAMCIFGIIVFQDTRLKDCNYSDRILEKIKYVTICSVAVIVFSILVSSKFPTTQDNFPVDNEEQIIQNESFQQDLAPSVLENTDETETQNNSR